MTRIDQFASVFRAAAKERFAHRPVRVRDVLVITDLESEAAAGYAAGAASFLGALPDADARSVRHVEGHRTSDLGALIDRVDEAAPDLIVTYRNLHTDAWRWPYTLGDHVEVLTQVCKTPILLLPRLDGAPRPGDGSPPKTVMAMTDHLAGDDSLVNWAVGMTDEAPGRRLVLAHVEDDSVFDRYIELLGKTPDIDTETARSRLSALLLKEPEDWIDSVRDALEEAGRSMTVEADVGFGHHLATYREKVDRHGVELLVLHTKDDDQLAMHGLAYPLVVELRATPMLLL